MPLLRQLSLQLFHCRRRVVQPQHRGVPRKLVQFVRPTRAAVGRAWRGRGALSARAARRAPAGVALLLVLVVFFQFGDFPLDRMALRTEHRREDLLLHEQLQPAPRLLRPGVRFQHVGRHRREHLQEPLVDGRGEPQRQPLDDFLGEAELHHHALGEGPEGRYHLEEYLHRRREGVELLQQRRLDLGGRLDGGQVAARDVHPPHRVLVRPFVVELERQRLGVEERLEHLLDVLWVAGGPAGDEVEQLAGHGVRTARVAVPLGEDLHQVPLARLRRQRQ
mmetsp:Transcript_5807/g.14735  ORF Transcript_5807/g.14735 Transcript_5807/m.14735 type:complete len:278 (-) Transcript_5807:230-1063(-)